MRVVTPVRLIEAPRLHTRRIESPFSEILQETIRKAELSSVRYGAPLTAL